MEAVFLKLLNMSITALFSKKPPNGLTARCGRLSA